MRKPKLLDTYCKAGGCTRGYVEAGFEVTGVDIEPQPNYLKSGGVEFIQADALEVLADLDFCRQFDVIHASPVCKRYSAITKTANTQDNHPDEIEEIRELLIRTSKPYVIENVPQAPLKNYVVLCGTMFGLNVVRHRHFECFPEIYFPPFTCNHLKPVVKHGRPPDREKNYAACTGHFSDVEFGGWSMGIDWMNQDELSQAIPPAYTKWIGEQLLIQIRRNKTTELIAA